MLGEDMTELEEKFRKELDYKRQYICNYPIFDKEAYIRQYKREFPKYFLKCCWFRITDRFENIVKRK